MQNTGFPPMERAFCEPLAALLASVGRQHEADIIGRRVETLTPMLAQEGG